MKTTTTPRCTVRSDYWTDNPRFKQYAMDIWTITNEFPLTISNGFLTQAIEDRYIKRFATNEIVNK